MRLMLRLLMGATAVSIGSCCSGRALPQINTPLYEYLDGVATQLRYRDEVTWLRNLAAYHQGESFVITMITGEAGTASIPLELTLSAGNKDTASGSLKAAAAPEIGVAAANEATLSSQSKVTVNLVVLDPGSYAATYKKIRDVFERYPLNEICCQVKKDGWDAYAASHDFCWPSFFHFETDMYYSVDERTRPKFRSMMKEIHDLKVEHAIKPIGGKKDKAPPQKEE